MEKVSDIILEKPKKKRGRPSKQQFSLTMQQHANRPPVEIPKSDNQRLRELKDLLIRSAGSNVVQKAVEIAMNDEHPSQAAMLKLCMDRMLPVSMFEKEKNQRSAVTISITGIGDVNIGSEEAPNDDIIDVEDKNG